MPCHTRSTTRISFLTRVDKKTNHGVLILFFLAWKYDQRWTCLVSRWFEFSQAGKYGVFPIVTCRDMCIMTRLTVCIFFVAVDIETRGIS